ncbi:MAG: hypothetical protein GTN62_00305 [Gemmatimonadales bacterium]|nr:hypothetical protein [Gemmatimonadales bacterium]NIN09847.1 hypothetical protein [Gemmatimonadales bacterium]NIN48550.1 hypothetical protein [Gemmatimonadales bacterium]NIP06014.1 hypothetical protein [Gemmatimonadales bacterium]NIR01163.1 hypothetical protein [Gemmatimonadales bacterium]
MPAIKLFRWRAVVPLGVFLLLLLGGSLLLLDLLVKRGVEEAGTYIVGAKVEVASADVRLAKGSVVLRGLQVTNPDAPMTNLVEADEIVADVMVVPLLEKKVVVETLAVRGVKFGTARETSGAIREPSPGSGRLTREVTQWAAGVHIPPFSLEGLGQVVEVAAIRPESLRTLVEARASVATADSVRRSWRREISALNPRPQIDSVRALVTQLQNANPLRLGIGGVTRLVGSARSTLTAFGTLRARVAALDSTAKADLRAVTQQVQGLSTARQADYAYARRLLNLPSLDAPDISPALFGEAAIGWVKPVLYWLRVAEQYLPPGLDPRRYAGPKRTRREGTTVLYPGRESHPRFLLEYGEVDFELGGARLEAGRYLARVHGLTSDPTVYGKPLELLAQRSGAAAGPRDVRVAALLNHVADPVRDSIEVFLQGLTLPSLELSAVGARMLMGEGTTTLSLSRTGGEIAARWLWRASNVTWEKLGGGSADRRTGGPQDPTRGPPNRQTARPPGWVEDLLWRTVSSLRDVRIEVRLAGPITGPSLDVSSNVGDAIAQGLRRELGREIRRAEQRVRAEVDALVQLQLTAVRERVNGLDALLRGEITDRLDELDTLRVQLEEELRKLTRRFPAADDSLNTDQSVDEGGDSFAETDPLLRGSRVVERRQASGAGCSLLGADLAHPPGPSTQDLTPAVHAHQRALREPSVRAVHETSF